MTPTDQAHVQTLMAAKPGTIVMLARSGRVITPSGDMVDLRMGDRLKVYARHALAPNMLVLQSLRVGRLVVLRAEALTDVDMEVKTDA